MSRKQTGIFECPALGEFPHDLAIGKWRQALGVWIVMFHVGVFLHELRVLVIFSDGGEHELMVLGAVIAQYETDLLALPNDDVSGVEQHLLSVLTHHDFDNTRRPLRISRLAC